MTDYVVSSGQVSSGIALGMSDTMTVQSGGTAIGTTMSQGGTEIVSSGGLSIGAKVTYSGSEEVLSGGSAVNGFVYSSGFIEVSGGGTTIGTTISGGVEQGSGTTIDTAVVGPFASFGNREDLFGGGSAFGTVVSSGGSLVVDGGFTSGTVLSNGAFELVDDDINGDGTAIGTIVSSGAVEEVFVASAIGVSVLNGGFLQTSSGSVISALTVESGGSLEANGGTFTDVTFDPTAKATLAFGAALSGLTLSGGGSIFMLNEGSTSDITVASGGTEKVAVFGVAISTVISSGGYEAVSSGGFTTATTIAGGTLEVLNFGSAVDGVTFISSGGTLDLATVAPPTVVVSGFGVTDRLDLQAFAYSAGGSATYDAGTRVLTVTEGTASMTVNLAGDYTGRTFSVAADSTANNAGTLVTLDAACFAAGTHILTQRGEVPVERLALGDVVMTHDGAALPVVWIGCREVDCGRHPEPAKVRPVRIAAHAFGPGRPERDLFLSPDHAVYAEGVLIPVRHLVDGDGIRQMDTATVRYFHVELPRHAVIIADGLPAESYLDTGDRAAFANADMPTMLHPRFASERADIALVMDALGVAPFRVTGAEVELVRARVAKAPVGWKSAAFSTA